jgi:putative spermidine/putrescine transport system permease protein
MTAASAALPGRVASGKLRSFAGALLRVAPPGLMVALIFVPFIPLVIWSLSERWFFPGVLPQQFSARAWRYLASDTSGVRSSFFASLEIAAVVSVVGAAIGLSAGRALGLYTFRGKRLMQLLVLAPIIVPPFAVTIGLEVLFIRYGLADTRTGVILAHLIPTTPYVVLVMSSVYANYEIAFEEQARVLGAGPVRVFLHITLPTVFPGLVVAALFAFLISWSEYILTLFVGGGSVITLPLLLFSFATTDPGIAAALSILLIAPAVVLLLFTSKYLSGSRAAVGGFGRL